MNENIQGWIDKAVADAKLQSWFDGCGISEKSLRNHLADYADDGMFKNENQVRKELTSFCNGQVRQIGRANFICTI